VVVAARVPVEIGAERMKVKGLTFVRNEAMQLEKPGIHVELTRPIIGAAIEVHRELGPGLLESAYEECLCHELSLRHIPFKRQVHVPVRYKGVNLDCCFRADLVVGQVVVELKTVEEINAIHEVQLVTYLRLLKRPVGLLINFNVSVLKDGIRRRLFNP
jgi:GxxExxY protein